MNTRTTDESNDDALDESLRRIDPLVRDLYEESAEIVPSDQGDMSSVDDLCPLYNSILRITARYQEPELLGRGGMKEVYRVFDARTVRHVALAKPLAQYSHDQYDAFLREAHLTARLEHPNIIDLFDMDVDDNGRPFFTMEFKRGRSLRAILNELRNGNEAEHFPLRERLAIFLRVCEAIAYAHSRRVLHLDIKPENIQVGEFGETQVCDWGLGVVAPSDEPLHDSEVLLDPDLYGPLLDSVKGTPVYMSPEQQERQTRKTPQMDIYALGCLLHEIVTLETYDANREKPLPIASALSAVIAKATQENPTHRYANANLLREDITRYLDGYSASVEETRVLHEAVLFYRRHREVCSVILGSLVVLALCVSYFIVQLRSERQAALTAQDDTERAWLRADMEKTIANMAKREAEQERLLAEDALAKYVIEKDRSEERLRNQVMSAVAMSDNLTSLPLMSHDTFSKTVQLSMKHLDAILDNTPPADSRVWHKKFWMHFLMQDFASATSLLDENKLVAPDLASIARDYEDKGNADGYLDTDDFISLIGDLCRSERFRAPLAEMMIVYDREYPRAIEDRVRIVRRWVRINNPMWRKERINYNPDTEAISIRGEGLRSLIRTLSANWPPGVRVNLLYTLNPRKLDIRNTEVSDLTQLDDLKLLVLDVRHTLVTDLSPLIESRSLRRLIVEAGQFPDEQIDALPDSIDVQVVAVDQ
ncbi:Serine/threonine protein kinase [Neorhodopirellula lusitana]|uniref:Serine/threonine protein kinase n=1 Tax=Neorhodopirellula lusitana TaxID=445327 RepID=A0ABY1QJD7_9BACT|nr:serine/threonine-protein kinase [Neorhodopirellula lusitana]SMP73215.1 Serine/threonine protein kinase [Neorhodopirellula lusitana]